ncbi:MAG: acetolactate synthase small subunit [Candidatus Marinimicrobia bacterium]|nr:acetolactate synthase small subunit [Candidatus Neomarinimicrobiota bacterium]
MKEKHTIIVTVVNKVGVLARISGLLAQRGFNIESIIGAHTEDPEIYKVTLVLKESDRAIEQVTKQLNKLVDTIKVTDISHKDNYIVREYIIIKVKVNQNTRSDIIELLNVFKAKLLDISQTHIITELSANVRKIDRFIDLMKPYGVSNYVRSGEFAMTEFNKKIKNI